MWTKMMKTKKKRINLSQILFTKLRFTKLHVAPFTQLCLLLKGQCLLLVVTMKELLEDKGRKAFQYKWKWMSQSTWYQQVTIIQCSQIVSMDPYFSQEAINTWEARAFLMKKSQLLFTTVPKILTINWRTSLSKK